MATSVKNVMRIFSRLAVSDSPGCVRQFNTQSHPLAFQASSTLNAMPQKKKKKTDMGLVLMREQRKIRKLEKAIRKIESRGRKLKPIPEIEGDSERKVRRPREMEPLSEEASEYRALLVKRWNTYKTAQVAGELRALDRVVTSQQRALQELRASSEELYQMAVQLDDKLFPFERTGPVETPPLSNYTSPDGEYVDTTKVFDK